MRRTLCILACAAALSACATATPYVSADPQTQEGYREALIEPGRWRVVFSGNSLTSREEVETYLLYRAAELTAANGYDWFTTVDRYTDAHERLRLRETYVEPHWSPRWRYAYGSGWYGWNERYLDRDFDVDRVTAYEASAEVVMGRGARPADDPHAYEARSVLQSLGPRIVRPAAPH